MRNFMGGLCGIGVDTSDTSTFNQSVRHVFANQLDKSLSNHTIHVVELG